MAASRDEKSPFDDLISVREAAGILHVSESTVWRWISRGILKAHRVGPKRVCLRRNELEPVLKPVVDASEDADARERRMRSYLRPMAPTPREAAEALVARMRKRHAEMLAERGGVPFPESWVLINEARDEYSESL